MGERSAIEWTDNTFNPWIGCQEVSRACDFCYAKTQNAFRHWVDGWGPHGERKRTSEANWRKPIRWNEIAIADGSRPRVFCASLADVFDNQVPALWRRDLFNLIRATPALEWQLLTKRPQNIVKMCNAWGGLPKNAALGTTTEDQEQSDIRIPLLRHAAGMLGALYSFVSVEPMLGPIDLNDIPWGSDHVGFPESDDISESFSALHPIQGWRLGWVICGGESGKHARPMHPDWARSLRDQCKAAGVPFFFKQWGEWVPSTQEHAEGNPRAGWQSIKPHPTVAKFADLLPENGAAFIERVGKKAAGRLLDGKTHDDFPVVAS